MTTAYDLHYLTIGAQALSRGDKRAASRYLRQLRKHMPKHDDRMHLRDAWKLLRLIIKELEK